MKMIDLPEVSPESARAKLEAALGDKIEQNRSLAEFSTFKTGGKALFFIEAETPEEISLSIKTANSISLPFVVIGGGSNLLISDGGYYGLVIKVHTVGIKLSGETDIICAAGEKLMDLVEFAADNSLSGIEFASGIAGTVGGAIFGNAGAYGGEVKDIITEISLITKDGDIKTVPPEYCKFEYRESYLKETKDIVFSAKFSLEKGDKDQIRKQIDETLAIRASKHPVEGKTAGSFFKNIIDPSQEYGKLPAGKLLEEIGAKEISVGGAAVYEKHANMIINKDNATSKDIRELADILKEKVFEKFGIMLEEEVISIGDF